MSKHKVKAHFSHKGKSYKPGDEFESHDEHEVQTLASQGHIEQQQSQGQQGQGQEKQGSQTGASGGSKASGAGAGEDPSKQGR